MRGNERLLAVVMGLLSMTGTAMATSSTTYWSPATPDIQPYNTLHIGVDNYFTVFKKADKGAGDFPTDSGLTIGVLPFEKVQMEIGVDLLEPSDYPLYFNTKLGTPEGSLFEGSPALGVGIYNVGTKSGVTDMNVMYGVVGRSIPVLGRVTIGGYSGNQDLLVDADGNSENTGFMIGYDRGFLTVKDKNGDEYSTLVLAADYMSGKNALGAYGAGIGYYFSKYVSILTGPVFFNEKAINGDWKMTVQLDINVPF